MIKPLRQNPYLMQSAAVFLGLFLMLSACGDDRENQGEDIDESTDDVGIDNRDTGSNDSWPDPRSGCNGDPDLCDRPFHEVVFPGTHNSMSNDEDDWGLPNQNLPLRDQLIDGIRVFLLDVHEEDGEVLLCHAACFAGSRPLLDAMVEFHSFLEANPQEIITIIFEDHVPAEKTAEILDDAGLSDFIYTHDASAGWPTLGEMIADDTRLVVTNESASPPPDWMHHVWDLGWDTPYSFSSPEEFSCDHNRGTTGGDLFLLNHWVLDPLPDPETAETVNAFDTLMTRVEECQTQWDRLPTFIAVDFYDVGDLMEVVDELNDSGSSM